MKIQFSKPVLDEKEIKAVARVLGSGWLAYGDVSRKFEERFAKYVGAKYAVFTDGCTAAMSIALRYLGIGIGSKVIIPSLTFTATASVVSELGATPIFGDVISHELPVLSQDWVGYYEKKADAVIPVYLTGIERYYKSKLPIIIDSAHRIEKNDFYHPNLAHCYSFYATKNMTTGMGGMLVTNERNLYDFAKLAVNDGVSKSVAERYKGSKSYTVDLDIGGKDNIDILAAIGIEQLKKVAKLNKARDRIVSRYNYAFGVHRLGNHLYYLLVENRDAFIKSLNDRGIQVGVHCLPLHKMPIYKRFAVEKLPITEYIGKKIVSLPLHPLLDERDVDYVIKVVKETKQRIQ